MLKVTRIFTHWIVISGLAVGLHFAADSASAAPAPPAGEGDQAGQLLAQAYTLTASGDRPGAEAVYRQMMECCPETGYPAYGRFLSRTAQTTAVEQLLFADAGLASQPVLVRARTFVSAGRSSEAVDLLRAPTEEAQDIYQRTILLTNQLEQLGQTEVAAGELEAAIMSAGLAPADQRDLFRRLLVMDGPDRLATVLPRVIESVVTSSTFTYPEIRELALAGLTTISMGPEYQNFHVGLEQNLGGGSPAHAWLFSLSCLKKGDFEAAQVALEKLTTSTMTTGERSVCLEELATMVGADTPRVIALYEEVLPLSNDQNRIRVYLAQHHFRAKNFSRTAEILKPLNFSELGESEQQAAMNLYLTSLGATGPMPELVDQLVKLSDNMPYEKVRDIAAAPFVHFSPDNLQGLRTAVDKCIDGTSATANAYILLMGLENLIGNNEGIYEALAKYTEAHPMSADAVRELADGLASEAWNLVADNTETSPPREQLEKAANLASKALWNSIRLKPYVPDPYEKLIALYRLYNQPEKAMEVPLYLSDRPNALPEEIHLAAYIYATQGYPEQSIPLYERALKMQDSIKFRLNYAAALGRVNRYEDAMTIYRDVIKHGVNGRQYNTYVIHSSALELAQAHGKEKEHLDFLMMLLNDPDVPQREIFLQEEGRVLVAAELYQEALHFFYKLKEEFPEEAVPATDFIVSTYAAFKDFDKARKVLSEEIAKTTEPENMAFMRNNLAMTYQLEGQIDMAVTQWQQLAKDMPQERTATRALLNAARALAQSGRIEQARGFYKNFVELATGDVTGEQVARDEMMRLNRMEVPTSMLLQSAALEYGPDNVKPNHAPESDLHSQPEDHSGHDHSGHDHAGHDHSGHDHAH